MVIHVTVFTVVYTSQRISYFMLWQCPWKIGDQCRAVYSEDNLRYDAEIVELDEETETCVIRYRGYGNEEEKNISELMRPTKNQKPRIKSDVEVWFDSYLYVCITAIIYSMDQKVSELYWLRSISYQLVFCPLLWYKFMPEI